MVCYFVSQGARWINNEPTRLAALKRLGKRGGAYVAIHWGMGTVEVKNIEDFVNLFGGCHGGPDRKHKTLEVSISILDPSHPVCWGISTFRIYDEFYYRLKFVKPRESITPLAQTKTDGNQEIFTWAWERSDGGRSSGFRGLHFHRNWQREEYRRLVV